MIYPPWQAWVQSSPWAVALVPSCKLSYLLPGLKCVYTLYIIQYYRLIYYMINMMKYEYMSARIYTYNHVYIYIHACHFGPLMSNLKRPHFPFVARVLPASMWTGSKRATISCFVWARQKTVWTWYRSSACTHFYPRFLYVRFSSQHFLIILWQFMCPVARCGKKIPTWSRELQLGCLKHQAT